MNTDKRQKAETRFPAFLRGFLPGQIILLLLIRVHPRKSAANGRPVQARVEHPY